MNTNRVKCGYLNCLELGDSEDFVCDKHKKIVDLYFDFINKAIEIDPELFKDLNEVNYFDIINNKKETH